MQIFILNKQLYLEKHIFTEKNKVFVNIIHIFFFLNIIIFQIALLHLNKHNQLHQVKAKCKNLKSIYK